MTGCLAAKIGIGYDNKQNCKIKIYLKKIPKTKLKSEQNLLLYKKITDSQTKIKTKNVLLISHH